MTRSLIEDKDTLEQMIDAHGLAHVLDTIASICAAKASNVSAKFPAANMSRRFWERATREFNRALAVIDRLTIGA